MTIEEIRRLADLEKNASPAPWHVRHLDDDACMGAVAISRTSETFSNESMRAGTWPTEDVVAVCLLQSPPYAMIDDDKFEENAELIAAIRNALPELLRLAGQALKE